MAVQHVIIGNGAAGLTAAEAVRAHDDQAEILILGDEPHGFYSRPGLAYLLTGELPERQLFSRLEEDYRRQRIRKRTARVQNLYPVEHQLALVNGERVTYDRLLLALGSSAAALQLPNTDLAGVVYLDNLADARRLVKLARRARRAVVVGGGVTALEVVEGLRARKVQVHYLLRRERYWSNVLDADESQLVLEHLKRDGVQVHLRTEIAKLIGKRGRLRAVETTQGETIRCDILGVSIGVRPRVQLAQAAGLEIDRGILVNEFLETSAPDVYAAGDVAQVTDPLTGQANLDVLWSIALEQGRNAGLNMAGRKTPYRKTVPFNVTRLAGIVTTLIGAVGRVKEHDADVVAITRGDSETWRGIANVLVAEDDKETNRLRLMVRGERIVGAVVMGDQSLSRPLHWLIAAQADIGPIRTALLEPQAPIETIITDYWHAWERAHATTAQQS